MPIMEDLRIRKTTLAIENAIGKEIHKIPATPEFIMEVMNDGKN